MAKIQLKCTKRMADLLNNNSPYTVVYGEMSRSLYGAYVDYEYRSFDYDINWKNDKIKYIKVIYPEEYYAIDKYITTIDLIRIWKHCTVKTLEGFINEFNAEVDC